VTKRLKATVYFAVLSPVLDAQAKATLTTLRNKVPAKATKIDVLIHGFVQPDHNTANDQSLSKNRAANVTSFLKGKGLPGEHTVIGLGRASDTGAKARRVEVTITYKVMQ
jgi:outer membrane protein OmpA-like peptidoglycan-associated protein